MGKDFGVYLSLLWWYDDRLNGSFEAISVDGFGTVAARLK